MNPTAYRIRFMIGAVVAAGALVLVLTSAARPSSSALHARSGVIAYDHGGRYGRDQIYAMAATGANPHPLTTSHAIYSYIDSYSPNGKQIVFTRTSSNWDLWTMNADGSHKRRLTFTRRIDESDAAWSPNGKEIAFTVRSPGRLGGIWIVDGDGRHRRVLLPGGEYDTPSWSPDGTKIAYAADFSSSSPGSVPEQIYVVKASGGSPTQLTHESRGIGDYDPAWSPDGRKILFSSDRGNSGRDQAHGNDFSDLWMMNPDGSDVQRVTNTRKLDESSPSWSPDGRWIAFSVSGTFHGPESTQIYVARPNGSQSHMITHPCHRRCTSQYKIINDVPIWQPLP